MTRFKFEVNPNLIGGASLDANPLTAISQVVLPPTGKHFDTLVAMGYPFAGLSLSAFRAALISDVYFRLKDSGILDKLDWFFLATGNIAGSMINLVPTKSPAVNTGSAYSAGATRTNGTTSFVEANFTLNRSKFAAADASVFVHLTVAPPMGTNAVLIGGNGSGSDVRLARGSTDTSIAARLNGTNTILPVADATVWSPGLFSMSREGDNNVKVYKNSALIATGSASTTASLPTEICIGKLGGSTFAAQAFSTFGGGKGLTVAEIAALSDITAFHAGAIAALDAN